MGNKSTSFENDGSSVDPINLLVDHQGQEEDDSENDEAYIEDRKERSPPPSVSEVEKDASLYTGENKKEDCIEQDNDDKDGRNQNTDITDNTDTQVNKTFSDNTKAETTIHRTTLTSEDVGRESKRKDGDFTKECNDTDEMRSLHQSMISHEDAKEEMFPIQEKESEVTVCKTSLSIRKTTQIPSPEDAKVQMISVNVNLEDIKSDCAFSSTLQNGTGMQDNDMNTVETDSSLSSALQDGTEIQDHDMNTEEIDSSLSSALQNGTGMQDNDMNTVEIDSSLSSALQNGTGMQDNDMNTVEIDSSLSSALQDGTGMQDNDTNTVEIDSSLSSALQDGTGMQVHDMNTKEIDSSLSSALQDGKGMQDNDMNTVEIDSSLSSALQNTTGMLDNDMNTKEIDSSLSSTLQVGTRIQDDDMNTEEIDSSLSSTLQGGTRIQDNDMNTVESNSSLSSAIQVGTGIQNHVMNTEEVDSTARGSSNIDDARKNHTLDLYQVTKPKVPGPNTLLPVPTKRPGGETNVKSAKTSDVYVVSSKRFMSSVSTCADGMNQYLDEYHRKNRVTNTKHRTKKYCIMDEMVKETFDRIETSPFVGSIGRNSSNNKTMYAARRTKTTSQKVTSVPITVSRFNGQADIVQKSSSISSSLSESSDMNIPEKMYQDNRKIILRREGHNKSKYVYHNDLATLTGHRKSEKLLQQETPHRIIEITEKDSLPKVEMQEHIQNGMSLTAFQKPDTGPLYKFTNQGVLHDRHENRTLNSRQTTKSDYSDTYEEYNNDYVGNEMSDKRLCPGSCVQEGTVLITSNLVASNGIKTHNYSGAVQKLDHLQREETAVEKRNHLMPRKDLLGYKRLMVTNSDDNRYVNA